VLDILEHVAAAQQVVGDVQDVVRFVVRRMKLQQTHTPIDLLLEPAVADQPVDRPDAAMRHRLHPIRQLVADARRVQYRSGFVGMHRFSKPPLDSVLSRGDLSSYLRLHSKGLSGHSCERHRVRLAHFESCSLRPRDRAQGEEATTTLAQGAVQNVTKLSVSSP